MNEYDGGGDLIEVQSLDEIPQFASEAEEADWWSTHELRSELWRQHAQRAGDKLVLVMPAHGRKRRGAPAPARRRGPVRRERLGGDSRPRIPPSIS